MSGHCLSFGLQIALAKQAEIIAHSLVQEDVSQFVYEFQEWQSTGFVFTRYVAQGLAMEVGMKPCGKEPIKTS